MAPHPMRRAVAFGGGVAAILTLLVLAAPAASAHEDRKDGDLEMAVGFGTEPAYVGQPNSAQIILTEGGQPVIDLGDTLKVEVSFGDQQPLLLTLEPFFEIGESGTPGDYRGWFIPTSAGSYTFHFTGSVDGQDVDETFTSGPKTFSDVETGSDIQYPVQMPATSDIVTRIQQDSDRAKTELAAAKAQAASAADDASSAKSLALVACVIGLLAVAAAGTAVFVARRPRKTTA
jgi:hypothetical protein